MVGEPRGARHGDRWVGLVALAAAALLFAETFNFRTVAWDPLGLAFWPRVVLILIAAFAAYFAVRGTVAPADIEPVLPSAFLVLAACTLYVLALRWLGFAVATPVFVFLFSYALGRRQRHMLAVAFALAVGTSLVVHLLFHIGLGVQLPRGRLFG